MTWRERAWRGRLEASAPSDPICPSVGEAAVGGHRCRERAKPAFGYQNDARSPRRALPGRVVTAILHSGLASARLADFEFGHSRSCRVTPLGRDPYAGPASGWPLSPSLRWWSLAPPPRNSSRRAGPTWATSQTVAPAVKRSRPGEIPRHVRGSRPGEIPRHVRESRLGAIPQHARGSRPGEIPRHVKGPRLADLPLRGDNPTSPPIRTSDHRRLRAGRPT